MNVVQPSGVETFVGAIVLIALLVILAAIVDAVRRGDAIGALLLVLLGPLGLLGYLVRRRGATAKTLEP